MSLRHFAVAAGMLAWLGVGLAGPALADVTSASGELSPGQAGMLAFAVSPDRTDTSTTRVEVRPPAEPNLGPLTAGSKPGWEISVERSDDGRATSVAWTAQSEDYGIRPGSFDVFSLRLDSVPTDTATLVFAAVQTYANGQTEEASEVTVRAGGDSAAASAGVVAAAAPAAPAVEALAEVVPLEEDDSTRVAIGLAAGGGALLLAFVATSVLRRSRPAPE